jgi:dethiobiotin synthase
MVSLRGLFVTGTDTGVGKTVAAAALMHRYRSGPETTRTPIRYWKPIQTGIAQDDDTAQVRWLGACSDEEIFDRGVRLERPLSPHLAARLSGVTIHLSGITELVGAEPTALRWIVEGAGGVLVPINDSQLMVDLIVALGLPALVVSRTALGTINHTLLTLEALRARSVAVAGVLMNGEPNRENRDAIEKYGGAQVVGELPRLEPLTPEAVARVAGCIAPSDDRLSELLS